MLVCSICGERTWNYEGATRVCMHGHKSIDTEPVIEIPLLEKPHWYRWKLAFALAWLSTIGAGVAAELLLR